MALSTVARPAPARPRARPPSGIWQWLDERLGLDSLSYECPAHANSLLYTLGGITAFGFVILVVTGIYLAQYYHPHPTDARASVQFIVSSTQAGSLIRSIHFWAANLVMVTLLLHMIRVFVTGAYKPPREANWLVGVGLFAVTMGFIFTGTVLKWDQEGWEALQHNVEVGKLLGGMGSVFTGGFTPSVPLLTRLYSVHITLLPLALFLLLGLHFWLVKRHGISSQPGKDESRSSDRTDTQAAIEREGAVTFAAHLRHLAGYGLLFLSAAGAGALLFGAPLGSAIVQGEEVSKPPWMFLPLYPFEDWFGIKALLYLPVVGLVALAAVPFVDRGRSNRLSRRGIWIALAAVAIAAYVALIILARLQTPQPHIMGG